MNSAFNFDAIRDFASLLEKEPLRLSSFEQVTEQLRSIGIKHRLACEEEILDQSIELKTGDADSQLRLLFPRGELEVGLVWKPEDCDHPERIDRAPENAVRKCFVGDMRIPWGACAFSLKMAARKGEFDCMDSVQPRLLTNG